MNTYRISITIAHGPEVKTRFCEFDVDALRPLTAVLHTLNGGLLTQFVGDQITITSQLYAENIFPLNDTTVREIVA